jgi:copper chaperone CopZ
MRFLVLFLVAAALQAEYMRVEMDFGGMNCASCADFIKNKLTKNPGVHSVSVDDAKGTLVVALNAGNTVKLSQIRDFVQQSGYKINETRISVLGQAIMDTGRTKVKVFDNDVLFIKDPDARLRELITRKVLVTGKLVKVQTDNGIVDVLNVTDAKHAQ